MKIAAIISEYNPLHNGHIFQIEQTKKITNCDAVICIMSGNFTQRAEPALLEKYKRAELATKMGADMVVLLPTAYSTNNAEIFARAAVKIASSFENVKYLSFGMENPDVDAVKELAAFFNNEPRKYKLELRKNLKEGLSFNQSRRRAIKDLLLKGQLTFINESAIIDLLDAPNNILAVEYVKSLNKINAAISPIAIKRVGSDHYDDKVKETFSSATSIRQAFISGKKESVKTAVPKITFNALELAQSKSLLPDEKILSKIMLYNILSKPNNQLQQIYNISEGLENLIKKNAYKANNIKHLLEMISTKRYKNSRLRSLLLNSTLDINKNTVEKIYSKKVLPFIKVMAVKNPSFILRHVKSSSQLILRKSDYIKISRNKFAQDLLSIEKNANELYRLITNNDTVLSHEQYRRFIKTK